MELKDLVGGHLLDAVDFSNEQVKTWGDRFEASEVMRFRLDGKVYTATEDPSDGYRSSMQDIAVGDRPMTNTFEPLRVTGRHRTKNAYNDEDDVLELIDVVTGKIVIEVGTSNSDDYYPSFVAAFHPEAMAHNAGKTSPL
jgi:hypothetical protein